MKLAPLVSLLRLLNRSLGALRQVAASYRPESFPTTLVTAQLQFPKNRFLTVAAPFLWCFTSLP
jgi:hypothetical protein